MVDLFRTAFIIGIAFQVSGLAMNAAVYIVAFIYGIIEASLNSGK